MSRRMSCSMTIDAVRARTKTVTRRHVDTWKALKPGDRLTLIEKGMGLPKGARQVVLAEVVIISVHLTDLFGMTQLECDREGFPELVPSQFIHMWLRSHHVQPFTPNCPTRFDVRRIEWRYLD